MGAEDAWFETKNKAISAALFKKIAPLLPVFTPSARGGRPSLSDAQAAQQHRRRVCASFPLDAMPQEVGFVYGMTCWRSLRDWQAAQEEHNPPLSLSGARRMRRQARPPPGLH